MKPLFPLPRFGTDWRARWWQKSRGEVLHRVAAISYDSEDSGHGATACGEFAVLHMPGLLSRVAAPRCRVCCAVAGIPEGNGAPYNEGIDE